MCGEGTVESEGGGHGHGGGAEDGRFTAEPVEGDQGDNGTGSRPGEAGGVDPMRRDR